MTEAIDPNSGRAPASIRAPGGGDRFDPQAFSRRLKAALKPSAKAALFGHPFRYFDEVTSTNDVAAEWAATGSAPEGAMAIAAAQTAGRGRTGRSWVSAAGAGLWFSLVLRPDLTYPDAGMLPLAIGFGLVGALRELGLPAALKWPNDIIVRGRKLGGVLVEAELAAGHLVRAVAGVGVNWTLPDVSDLSYRVTALTPEFAAATGDRGSVPSGPAVPPETVLAALLGGIEKAYLVLKMAGSTPFVTGWPRFSAHFARPVLVLADPIEGSGSWVGPTAGPTSWARPSAGSKGFTGTAAISSAREALGGRLHGDGSLEIIAVGGRRERLAASEVSLGLLHS